MSRDRGLVTWRGVCLDVEAGRAQEMGAFWALAIGGRPEPGRVEGPPGGSIELCAVPEPRTVKNRVHLDVYTPRIAELVDAGARMLLPAEDSGFGWSVLRDPEGGEFCAFRRDADQLPDYRLHGLAVDSVDHVAIARWWGGLFGVEVQANTADDGTDAGAQWSTLEGIPGNPILSLDFAPVPEPKTVKNRIHWDIHGDVPGLEAAGATVRARRERWVVMADPEGNEFCVFPDNGAV